MEKINARYYELPSSFFQLTSLKLQAIFVVNQANYSGLELARVPRVPGTRWNSEYISPLAPADFENLSTNLHPQSSFYVASGTLSFKFLTQALLFFWRPKSVVYIWDLLKFKRAIMARELFAKWLVFELVWNWNQWIINFSFDGIIRQIKIWTFVDWFITWYYL